MSERKPFSWLDLRDAYAKAYPEQARLARQRAALTTASEALTRLGEAARLVTEAAQLGVRAAEGLLEALPAADPETDLYDWVGSARGPERG